MENVSELYREEGQMELPPGFRFHPTDEELISQYLYKKVTDTSFFARAIGEVDLNKSEPWELPCKFLKMGFLMYISLLLFCRLNGLELGHLY